MRTRPLGTDWLPSRSVLSPGFGGLVHRPSAAPASGSPQEALLPFFSEPLLATSRWGFRLARGPPPYRQGHDGDSPNLRLRGCVLVGEDEWPATRCSPELSLSRGQTFSRAAVVSRPDVGSSSSTVRLPLGFTHGLFSTTIEGADSKVCLGFRHAGFWRRKRGACGSGKVSEGESTRGHS